MIERRWAVVGGGVAGLACARRLAEAGIDVVVFDKARRAGGRISTRRARLSTFDHGAQYFTARERRFETVVRHWVDKGVVSPWEAKIVVLDGEGAVKDSEPVARYVGIPTMSRVAAEMSEGLDVRASCRITHLSRTANRWWLISESGAAAGPFDGVTVAVPPAQAVPLLSVSPDLSEHAAACEMSPCWAVMAVALERLRVPFDGAFVENAALGWVARNSSKPGRNPRADSWVLHATAQWTRAHWDDEAQVVASELWQVFLDRMRISGDGTRAVHLVAHQWRFARPTHDSRDGGHVQAEPTGDRELSLFDPERRVGACGDWCAGPRVEGAFLSGLSLAERIVDREFA